MSILALFAIAAGAAIAIQATMNAQLGVVLKNSILATCIAFLLSFMITVIALLLTTTQYPNIAELKSVPAYLWCGGILSAFGVAMFYVLIPKMGAGNMMSYALTGQLLIALLASHFGWFNLPVKSIDSIKTIGAILLIIGVVFINWRT